MSEALTFADVERIVRAMAAVGIFLRTLRRIGGDLVLTTDNCAGAFEDLAAAETPALYAAMRHELDSLDRANPECDAARDPYHAVARVLRRHGRAADGTTEDSTTFWAARWDGPRAALGGELLTQICASESAAGGIDLVAAAREGWPAVRRPGDPAALSYDQMLHVVEAVLRGVAKEPRLLNWAIGSAQRIGDPQWRARVLLSMLEGLKGDPAQLAANGPRLLLLAGAAAADLMNPAEQDMLLASVAEVAERAGLPIPQKGGA